MQGIGQRVQQGNFACPGQSDQSDLFARPERPIQVVRGERAAGCGARMAYREMSQLESHALNFRLLQQSRIMRRDFDCRIIFRLGRNEARSPLQIEDFHIFGISAIQAQESLGQFRT